MIGNILGLWLQFFPKEWLIQEGNNSYLSHDGFQGMVSDVISCYNLHWMPVSFGSSQNVWMPTNKQAFCSFHDEALKCFDRIRQEGILPNDITYRWSVLGWSIIVEMA